MREYLFAITSRPATRPKAVARINELVGQHGLLIKQLVQHEDTLYVVFISREPIEDFPVDERVT